MIVSSDLKVVVAVVLSLLTAGAVGYLVSLFNRLVHLRNNIEKAWKNIDALLVQRNDEIPKLIDLCNAYLGHEREIIKTLGHLRRGYERAGSRAQKVAMENQISPALRDLIAEAEGYPQLQANELFGKTMRRLSDLETTIADRRIFFNETVVIYNIQIGRLPQKILAWGLGYGDHPYLLTPGRERPSSSFTPSSLSRPFSSSPFSFPSTGGRRVPAGSGINGSASSWETTWKSASAS